ncbi:MAG: DUF423 domain-containing protein [Calditrichae bacterium]|nr:DUF423 domain-containing protein [Calditrichota bacterium]MCB0293994.1 DUF423 domain-containing protein [Calditrichota bacterium]MCB0312387.1 DUF423 domain-containing protein [Calditrichota bacterium]MCB9089739.1 DUF423 domain-containing protein [Calditrichia bacterium]
MAKTLVLIGSICAFLGIALGAFGAHALRERLPADLMAVYQTGVLYHLVHALALVLTGALLRWMGATVLVTWAGWLFLAGIVLFSGSLYLLSMTGIRALGAITPFGGLSFLIGWALLAVAAWKG